MHRKQQAIQHKAPLILLAVLSVLTIITFTWLAQKTPVIADTSGYIHAGLRVANGQGLTFADPNNEAIGQFFSPFAFQIKQANNSQLYLGYPPGFPLLLALPVAFTGMSSAIFFVVPFISVLGLLFTFLLGKLVTGNNWSALLATFLLATLPAYWQFGTDAWSEVPSLAFILAGTYFYLLSREEDVSSNKFVTYSVLGGTLLVYSLFIRYANITFLLSIGLAELLYKPAQLLRPSKRWYFYLILAVGLGLILLFNHFYYGGVSLTSYSPENGWYTFSPFAFEYALGPTKSNLPIIFETLWDNFSILLLLAPVGVIFLPKRYRLLFVFSVLSSMLLYSVYRFSATGINSRFLVPTYPFLAILVAESIARFLPKVRPFAVRVGILILLIGLTGWRIPAQIDALEARNEEAATLTKNVATWVADTPENSVIMSYVLNDQIAYYGNRSVLNYRRIPQYDPTVDEYRYDLLEPCLVYAIDTLLLNSTPVFYIEDGDPPLYNSKARLENYYELEPFRLSPKMFAVQAAELAAPREVSASCSP
ncbi:hypothetical protein [Candidatus Leptofilum sp.]|uniref:hypothetical protein n=1 Tax=Candidatus Leptofilum sp. TaxID=3241576 RepID=UPI003B5B745C